MTPSEKLTTPSRLAARKGSGRRATWAALLLLSCVSVAWCQAGSAPVKVQVETPKEERVDIQPPVDPTPRIQVRGIGATFTLNISDTSGKRLHMGHMPSFKIGDTAVVAGSVGGRYEKANAPLPKKGTKARNGYMNIWIKDDMRITQEVELAPSKAEPGERKRQMNAVLIRYTVENKGKTTRSFGMRTTIDSYLGVNRQCKFAAPNRPGKVLEQMEFKARDIPPYLQVLQQPNLKSPGQVAHVTFGLGSGVDRPDRLVLTSNLGRRDLWDLPVQGGGFGTLVGFFWEPKEIRPGGKREFAYGYGLGVAAPLSPEANFQIDLGGSFEIGKTFTISALVVDPGEGQALELDLPKGLERLEGKLIQPIPLSIGDTGGSVVLWKGRVREYGRFPIQIRSNTGITKTTIVTVSPAADS